jgi:uncharacterized membrane protein
MTLLIVGLIVFLGAHSVRIFAEDWRTRQLARVGERKWKAAHSIVSIAGLVLLCWGYAVARGAPVDVFSPPAWTRHAAALLALLAFVLLAAAKVPGTRIKAGVGHPMVLGVKVWALGHLIANGRLADLVLFGAFLVWSVLDYRAARGRDRASGTAGAGSTAPAGTIGRDALAFVIGFVAWAAFALYLHAWLIGVRPFG